MLATIIFVGRLSLDTTECGLRALFERVGKVEAVSVVVDHSAGHSRSFGFVEMSTRAEARRAIAEFHGKTVDGHTITVSEARDPPAAKQRRGPSRTSGGHGQ